MKIVAKISNDRVLVEMTANELAKLNGKNYESQLVPHNPPYGQMLDGLEVGTTYDIAPAWDRLYKQQMIPEKLEAAATTLAALSELITQTKVQITALDEVKP